MISGTDNKYYSYKIFFGGLLIILPFLLKDLDEQKYLLIRFFANIYFLLGLWLFFTGFLEGLKSSGHKKTRNIILSFFILINVSLIIYLSINGFYDLSTESGIYGLGVHIFLNISTIILIFQGKDIDKKENIKFINKTIDKYSWMRFFK